MSGMLRYLMIFLFLSQVPLPASSGQSHVGKIMPALAVEYVSNAPAATTGKAMIVEFWATWCGPCRQSIPHLNEIYQAYKNRGLVVVGISNESKDKISEFMKSMPMQYSVAVDAGGKFGRQFDIRGIPHAFLVDASGKIVWEGHPMSMKTEEVEKILARAPAPSPAGTAPAALPPLPGGNKKFY